MASPKLIPVTLDKERHARLVLADVQAFRRATVSDHRPRGIDLMSGAGDLDWIVDEWIALFWAILRHEDESLTVDAVAEMVGPKEWTALVEAWTELLADFFPDAPEGIEGVEDLDPPTPAT